MPPECRPIPFADFLGKMRTLYAGPAHAPRTATKMMRLLGLLAGVGVATTADLTTEAMARFVIARSADVSPNTVRGDLDYLRAACNYAVEELWLDRCPRFRRVRPRRAEAARKVLHAVEDVGRVLALLRSRAGGWEGQRLHALAAVAAYTGLRRDELLYLRVEDVRLEAGVIDVVARRRLKTEGSAAPVPVPPELGPILAAWLPRAGRGWLFPGVRKRTVPWTGGALGNRPCDQLRRAGEECGVAGLTFQSLRHTFATWCRRRWGLSQIQLQDCLRHSSPATQELYIHADPGGLVQSVRNVSYLAAGDVANSPHPRDNG